MMAIGNLPEKIRNAGVVGAGGAGFPTHVKLKDKVEFLIGNGAECEPLLHKDKELMRLFAAEIVSGLKVVSEWLGPRNTIFGIKAKNKTEIDSVSGNLYDGVKLCLMSDVYPAGDEFVLVYEATGRSIPPGGIPLEIGCVVTNVETLYNINLAAKGVPVTEKCITVAGAVVKPSTFRVPVGTSFADCIMLAGGPTVADYCILAGGAMMGELVTELSTPVTKTTAGLIVLARDHALIHRRSLPARTVKTIGASACDQCYRCTELCPRWLLGYHIEPHQVMRSLLFGAERWEEWSIYSLNCCECNICSLFACPEDLDPKNITAWAKKELFARGIRPDKKRPVRENPTRFGRQVPTKLLTSRLGLASYDVEAPFVEIDFVPNNVTIPLKQHIGVQAMPAVKVGDRVRKGDLIGEIRPEDIGARVHASMDGRVEAVDGHVTITKE